MSNDLHLIIRSPLSNRSIDYIHLFISFLLLVPHFFISSLINSSLLSTMLVNLVVFNSAINTKFCIICRMLYSLQYIPSCLRFKQTKKFTQLNAHTYSYICRWSFRFISWWGSPVTVRCIVTYIVVFLLLSLMYISSIIFSVSLSLSLSLDFPARCLMN